MIADVLKSGAFGAINHRIYIDHVKKVNGGIPNNNETQIYIGMSSSC